MAKYMRLPFSINGSGEVNSTTSRSEIYKQYVACVLLTNRNERVMRPLYGSEVVSNVFENYEIIRGQVESEIREALSRWVPDITVLAVTITDAMDDGKEIIDLHYRLHDGTEDSVTLTRGNIVNNDGAVLL